MNNVRALATPLLALLASCSEAPTELRLDAPTAPERDGAHTFGSKNVVPTDTSASTTTADPTSTAAEPSVSPQERGGLGYGSGN